MLANTRPCFLVFLFLALLLAACLPAASQVQAAQGGDEVLRPFLGNCCANIFLPRPRVRHKIKPPLAPGRSQDETGDETMASVPAYFPYIPYAIGYEPGADASNPDEMGADDYAYDASGSGERRTGNRDAGDDAFNDAWDEGDDAEPSERLEDEPVIVQPSTVLVFKDGDRGEVVNYAIVGGSLYDFDEGHSRTIPLTELDIQATLNANGVRGVEFKLPPAAEAASK